jgi:hypothetical protein
MFYSLLSKLALPLYALGGGVYITTSMYHDAKTKLEKFRNNTLDEYDRKFCIHSEDDAVREGAYGKFGLYIATAMIWPICIPIKYIPSIALMMNKNDEK